MPIVVRKQAVAAQEIVEYYPEPGYVSFTAKAQRSRTRKGKDYFVIRVTVPRYAAEQINAGPDDFLVLKAKKALWYHMMDWNEMTPAWRMLPPEIKADVIMTGLPNPDYKSLGATGSIQIMLASPQTTTWNNQHNPQLATPITSSIGAGGQ